MFLPGSSTSRGRLVASRLLLLFLCLAFQEVVLRLVFPLPEIRGFNRIHYMNIGLEGRETRAIRSIRVVQESSLDDVKISRALNEYGFRGGRWATRKTDGVPRVFFVGDSFVEGGLASEGETTPRGFQTQAEKQGVRVEALNLGVNGSGLDSYVRLIVDASPVLKPDVVFLVLYANDLPGHAVLSPPETFGSYPALKPRFLELLAMARNREQLPYRVPWRTENFLRPVPSPDNPWSDQAFEARFQGNVSPPVLAAMKAGRFSPYRLGGSLYLESSLQTAFDIRDTLGSLREFLQRFGSRLIVLYIPERGTVTNYYRGFERAFSQQFPADIDMTLPAYHLHRRLLREQCSDQSVLFLDTTDFVKQEEDAGRHLYFNYDDHLTGTGNVFIGATAFQWFAAEFNQLPSRQ